MCHRSRGGLLFVRSYIIISLYWLRDVSVTSTGSYMTWEGENWGGKVTCDPTSLVYNSLSGHMVQGQLESQCSHCHKNWRWGHYSFCVLYIVWFSSCFKAEVHNKKLKLLLVFLQLYKELIAISRAIDLFGIKNLLACVPLVSLCSTCQREKV